ncbi:MAG: alanyl-tRNA editing protein [Oscillospiraceae bacterium]|nr:alanyl-tRNA editing protein [Oscillospiraceae bacterium]
MKTEKLYYQDAFLTDFTAQVLACEPRDGKYFVALDRTAFYPEGGGQPADTGTLGGVAVLDVHERGETIVHTCDAPLEVGATVAGQIDWARRWDHMQQHSGEHIISGILCEMFDCDNVGFHLGADTVTIDYNAVIPWEGLLEAEAKANTAIWEDKEAEITFPSPEELETMSYRSKKALSGDVRIVTFPGADRCACCGTHVKRAGQVGLVKVISCQKFRDGVRIEILCGKRAVDYLSAVFEQDRAVGQRLSVKPTETLSAVERLEAELAAVKEQSAALETELFDAIARENAGAGNALLFRAATRPDSVRRFADAVARQCGGLAAAFAGQDGAGYVYALVRADGQAFSVKEMNAALHGRGGGRGGFAQGSVQATRAEIEAFFREHPGLA